MYGQGPGSSFDHVSERKEFSICLSFSNIVVLLQGEGNEEGSWLLHNAMRDADGVAYHPECFKEHSRNIPPPRFFFFNYTIYSSFNTPNSL